MKYETQNKSALFRITTNCISHWVIGAPLEQHLLFSITSALSEIRLNWAVNVHYCLMPLVFECTLPKMQLKSIVLNRGRYKM